MVTNKPVNFRWKTHSESPWHVFHQRVEGLKDRYSQIFALCLTTWTNVVVVTWLLWIILETLCFLLFNRFLGQNLPVPNADGIQRTKMDPCCLIATTQPRSHWKWPGKNLTPWISAKHKTVLLSQKPLAILQSTVMCAFWVCVCVCIVYSFVQTAGKCLFL